MLIPLFLLFGIAAVAVIVPFMVGIAYSDPDKEKQGRRLVNVFVSLIMGGICVGLGYCYSTVISIVPVTSFMYSDISFPLLDWLFPYVLPIFGWISMIGGALVIILGIYRGIFSKAKKTPL